MIWSKFMPEFISLTVVILLLSLSCKDQNLQSKIKTYKSKIIGIWQSEDDPHYKIEFTNDGIRREYIDNQLQKESYAFQILDSCGTNSSNGFDLYLKIINTPDDYNCDIINNISTDSNGKTILSLTTERG